MPRLEYFLVSESVCIDQNTNRVSVFNIFEVIGVPAFPYRLPHVEAVSTWEMGEEDSNQVFQITLRVCPPDGGPPVDFPQELVGKAERHRIFFGIEGIVLRTEGVLKFELLLNNEHQAWHKVVVFHSDEPDREKFIKRVGGHADHVEANTLEEE